MAGECGEAVDLEPFEFRGVPRFEGDEVDGGRKGRAVAARAHATTDTRSYVPSLGSPPTAQKSSVAGRMTTAPHVATNRGDPLR